MTHRERLLAALNHQEPDRVPMDLGSARFTGMVRGAHDRLCSHLGFGRPGAMIDRMQQLCEVDEQILERLDVAARPVNQGGPDRGGDEDLDENRGKIVSTAIKQVLLQKVQYRFEA